MKRNNNTMRNTLLALPLALLLGACDDPCPPGSVVSKHHGIAAFSQTMANFVRNSVLMHSRPVLLAIEALESCPAADDARSRVRRALSVLREGSVLEGSVTCPDCELEFPRGDEHVCNATRID